MIKLIGMGPGHLDYVSRPAIEAIQAADLNVAFGRIAETAEQITPNIVQANTLNDVIDRIKSSENAAVLASGDACFFGILDYLKKQSIQISQIIPGISSFQYMMANLQISWHNASFFSLHGREPVYDRILTADLSVILTDKTNTPDLISKTLAQKGARGTIYTGTDLSYETEAISQTAIGDRIPTSSALSTVIVALNL